VEETAGRRIMEDLGLSMGDNIEVALKVMGWRGVN
jgi:hypothetical protein